VCGLCTILGQRGAGRRRGGFDLLRLLRCACCASAALHGWMAGWMGGSAGQPANLYSQDPGFWNNWMGAATQVRPVDPALCSITHEER
jgi:hypothetical protein